jgi:hypothetical protein
MIATLIIWLYVTFLALVYGFFCIEALKRWFHIPQEEPLPIIIIIILGLGFITFLAGIFTLVMPLSWLANLLLFVGSLGIVFKYHRLINDYLLITLRPFFLWKKSPQRTGTEGQKKSEESDQSRTRIKHLFADIVIAYLMISRFLVILVRTSEIPHNYDSGLYHAQAIRWLETFATVPGLGNLESRLAFNSAWFLPTALFSFSFLNIQSFHVLNGLLFLLANLYLLGKLWRLLLGTYSTSNFMSIPLIYLSMRLLYMQLSSPGTDLPATLLTWIIFLLALEKIEAGKSDEFDMRSLIILLFSAFDVIIKLSAFPILILPAYFLIRAVFSGRKTQPAFLMAMSGVIFLPWLVRSVILSGYLIYPITWIDLFNPDWKMPLFFVQLNSDWITSWSRLHTYDAAMALSKSFSEWFPVWWQIQVNFDRLILMGISIGSILFIILIGWYLLAHRDKLKIAIEYSVLFITGWIGIGYWFLKAPDVRFGYGFLVMTVCLLFLPIVMWILSQQKRIVELAVYAAVLILVLHHTVGLYKISNFSIYSDRWLLPANYPTAEVKPLPLGNFTANTPVKGYQCWYAALPCTEMNLPAVHLRSESLSDGFYTSK